jgi:PIN domain nuclease of toxin-antitoxin system
VIHLDTHVAVWLYEGRVDRLSSTARSLLEGAQPLVSPMFRLELAFLHEIGRLTVSAPVLLDALRLDADLGVAEPSFERVAAVASTLSWTRDPFDRLIAAHALADDVWLITRDERMRQHCAVARWD